MPADRKRISARLLKEMIVILAIACALGAAVNLIHPRGYVLVSRSLLEERTIVSISAEEARVKRDAGIALFIDARDRAEYDYSRIPGAISLPWSDAAARGGPLSVPDRPAEAVIYCDGVSCGSSMSLARMMRKQGRRRVLYIISGGFPEWESRGYPVERGERNER